MSNPNLIYPSTSPGIAFYVAQLVLNGIATVCLASMAFGMYIMMALGAMNVGNSVTLSILFTLLIWGVYFALLWWFGHQTWLCVRRLCGKEGGREPWLFSRFAKREEESIVMK